VTPLLVVTLASQKIISPLMPQNLALIDDGRMGSLANDKPKSCE
jgi:hypothetical protein